MLLFYSKSVAKIHTYFELDKYFLHISSISEKSCIFAIRI